MKIFLIPIIIVISIFTAACTYTPQGPQQNQTLNVSDFSAFEYGGHADIYVRQSETPGVIIEASNDTLERLEIEQEDDKLTIRHRNIIGPTERINIYLTMPQVRSLALSGSGTIQSETPIETEDLDIDISGSGTIRLDVDAQILSTDISGSGSAYYAGTVESHMINAAGSARIYAFNLTTQNTTLESSGSSSAELNAQQSLDVRISGSGSVKYMGSPQVSQRISGSGTIESAQS